MSWLWTDVAQEADQGSHLSWKSRTTATIFLLLVMIDAILLILFAFSMGANL
jgi:hypothetical protein